MSGVAASPRLIVGTRVVALVAGAAACVAWWPLIFGWYDEGGIGQHLNPLLGALFAAGAALGLRFLPLLRDIVRRSRRPPAYGVAAPTLADIGILLGAGVLSGEIAVLAHGDLELLGAPLLVSLLGALGLMLGLLAGMIVLGPIWLLVEAIGLAAAGRPVVATSTIFAGLLLTVVALAITVQLALVQVSDRSPPRARGWDHLIAVIFGIPVNGAEAGSSAWVWVARGLLVVTIGLLVALGFAARRTLGRRRRSG